MTSPPTAATPVVAAFDLDGTLTRRDNVGPFLRRVAGRRLVATLAGHPAALLAGLLRRDHDALKALACAALAGLPAADVRQAGTRYAATVHARRLRPDTRERLQEHRRRGHAVVLVTASLEPYVLPLGRLLGVDGALSTRLEVGPDGRLTGALDGANCRGEEKARRLRRWLDEHRLADAALWAYGDSAGDDALLAMADHPVRVGRAPVPPLPVA